MFVVTEDAALELAGFGHGFLYIHLVVDLAQGRRHFGGNRARKPIS
jgi:hypothetical protein